jgi:AraC family transcriptional regulator, regulatory protein of adaptative response / DNA-3-methyladenine glycosylase II
MNLDLTACYQALVTHDTRFDGTFFVGVSTTGVYCRPVCRARTPRPENCSFFPSAAAAEQSGYRPCLRCRPELAPGKARIDAIGRLAAVAASRIEDGAFGETGLDELAAELGVSARHLRRVVRSELGVSPIELAQTHRLLLAKRLLTDTDLPIADVAFASGFSSVRRLNTLFQERYRLQPSALRSANPGSDRPASLRCDLAYRPPFDWEGILRFLTGRAIPGVERIIDNRYFRTVKLGDRYGWLAVEPAIGKNALTVEVSPAILPKLVGVLARVKRLFDLSADPELISGHLGELATNRPGLRVPGAFNGFEMAVRAILGQQVSVKGATTVMGRFVMRFGEPIETGIPGLTHVSPAPAVVAAAGASEIAALGMPGARASAVLSLASAVTERRISLNPTHDVEGAMARLVELPGIGAWTASYIAMRALSWPDAFPSTDLWILRSLNVKKAGEAEAIAERWRPWRSYAVMHLWRTLEAGL